MYDDLIQRLYAHCNTDRSDAITTEAADAIAALQAENAFLQVQSDKMTDRCAEVLNEKDCVEAELAAAVEDLRYSGQLKCAVCKHSPCGVTEQARRKCYEKFEWRGAQGEG